MLLEAGAGDEAQASEAIQASYDGDEMQIAFNPQYLLDGIGAVDSDTVRISFTTPDQARRDHRQGRGHPRLPLRDHAHPVGGLIAPVR